MTVNVHCSHTRSRCIMAIRCSIIVDKRHDNTSRSSRVHHILHVLGVELLAIGETGVFVLGLIQDDGTAIGDLGFGKGSCNVGSIAVIYQWQLAAILAFI